MLATNAAVKDSTLAHVVRLTCMPDSLKLKGRRITVIMTRKMPRENRKRTRNFLLDISTRIADFEGVSYAPPDRLILSKAGRGRIIRMISVKMFKPPTTNNWPTA